MPGRSGFLLSNVVPQKVVSYDLTKFSYVGGAGSAVGALWLRSRRAQASGEPLPEVPPPGMPLAGVPLTEVPLYEVPSTT